MNDGIASEYDYGGPSHSHSKLLNPNNSSANPRAVAVGLFGLDCEHGCKSEVHPVLAFAIETNAEQDDDTWMLFVRNWGNGGFCSGYRHLVDFPQNQLSILLFDGADSDGPAIIPEKTKMFASAGSGVSFPTLSYWQGRGPVLTFTLPPAEQKPVYAELEIHLRWNHFEPPSCGAPTPALVERSSASSAQDAEEYLRQIKRKLGEQNPEAMKPFAEVHVSQMAAAGHLVEVHIPANLTVQAFTPPPKPPKARAAAPALSEDKRKSASDIRNIQLLCQAYQNHLPPYKGQDISAQVCDEKKLSKRLQTAQH